MKKYTVGALFTPDLTKVLLIRKRKPEWQRGKMNFPGGHIEEGETKADCVSREFEEEAGVKIASEQWKHIGTIENPGEYYVEFFTALYYPEVHGQVESKTEESLAWESCMELPNNVISNLHWLVPFAMNTHLQGNAENLKFGHFTYQY